MKKHKIKPTHSKFNILRQICNLIPQHTVSRIARETGAEDMSRTIKPWSHVVSQCYAQLTHSISLNDVCDSLQLHSGPLASIRGATPPSRNGFSNANRERPAEMAEKLFWAVMGHLREQSPGFVAGRRRGAAFRFRVPIHVVDTTVMELVANCMDWAKHRRRKAAAKTHMRLNLQSLLPNFVIIDTAGEHDNKRARELCAGVRSGEIVLFDRGYLDFGHLKDLDERGAFWVTRAKDNLAYEVVKKMPQSKDQKILLDELIVLSNPNKPAPELMRRIVALVEIDGEEREMVFLTNHLQWSPRSVADLYRCRWQIEVFFKQIKQTLQLADFLGHNANAVRWQVWIALLVYVLLRYTTGIALELNRPQWTVRYGFFQMPGLKNGFTAEDKLLIWPQDDSASDGEFWRSWGMVTELERRWSINAHPGAIRLLAFLDEADMGSYEEAVNNPTRPADIAATRTYRFKYGFGLNWEQEVLKDVGVFSRLGWNDGHDEGWTFTDINYSGSLGISNAPCERPG